MVNKNGATFFSKIIDNANGPVKSHLFPKLNIFISTSSFIIIGEPRFVSLTISLPPEMRE